jgi:hypothetical protein
MMQLTQNFTKHIALFQQLISNLYSMLCYQMFDVNRFWTKLAHLWAVKFPESLHSARQQATLSFVVIFYLHFKFF